MKQDIFLLLSKGLSIKGFNLWMLINKCIDIIKMIPSTGVHINKNRKVKSFFLCKIFGGHLRRQLIRDVIC